MKKQPGFFGRLANQLKKPFISQPPAPPFEDPSRSVFDGLVGFLPVAEFQLREGREKLTARLKTYNKYFLNLHRQGFVAFLSSDQGEQLSELLTEVSYEYKTANMPPAYRAMCADRARIAKYLALEALSVNMHGKIREKTLSDFLDLLSSEARPAPPQPPTIATTNALPKPFKTPPPGTEATTRHLRNAIKKVFQPKRPTPPPTQSPPQILTVEVLAPGLDKLLRNWYFSKDQRADYAGTVKEVGEELLKTAIEELPQDDITKTFPGYLHTLNKPQLTEQEQRILAHLFDTLAHYYQSHTDPDAARKAEIALYLSEILTTSSNIATGIYARAFIDWRNTAR